MSRLILSTVVIALLPASLAAESSADAERFWPHWRGPHDTGVAPLADPPIEWSETKNIRWKVPIPGKGSASPIVWGDRVFVTTAIDTGDADSQAPTPAGGGSRRGPRGVTSSNFLEYEVIAFARSNGEILWRRTASRERPHEGRHPTGTFASNSAVTDGEALYAYFGSRGLYAYDLDGELLWKKDFGDMRKRMTFGEGSSPALFGDTLVVIWDHEGQSFVVAVDKKTGNELWRTDRDEFTSWTTPLVVETGGRVQVVTSATSRVRSYDLANGTLLWHSKGVTLNAIPSPVSEDGIVYVMSGFRGNELQAIRLADAKGDIEATDALLWRYDQDTPYVSSPLLYDGYLYFLKSNSAVLSVFEAETGDEQYVRQRVAGLGNVYSSPVGAAGRVYLTDRIGNTVVVRAGPHYEVLASNSLDDDFDASAAIVDGEIYLRGANLYCIAAD